jgi:hypothetical protein
MCESLTVDGVLSMGRSSKNWMVCVRNDMKVVGVNEGELIIADEPAKKEKGCAK